ncbi:MAG: chromosomal replication initiator protein DnaA [Fimbriimonadaceae bacterium]
MDQLTLSDRPDVIQLSFAWDQAQRRIKGQVPQAAYDRFIKPLTPLRLSNGVATFNAPGSFVRDWVNQKFRQQLERILSDELGRVVTVAFETLPRQKAEIAQDTAIKATPGVVDSGRFKPNERFTFERFVVGQSNRLAYAGAKAVTNEPGGKFNPLFIYGDSGLGKTHLLHAIANELQQNDPSVHVAYVTAQQFAEDFVQALQTNRIDQFRRAQRNVSVWLVDDIQFVAGRDKTQEELFHTFNYLHSLGKQIVLIADRPPRDLQLMDERLRSRFEAGLVADIQMPDTETRCAILLNKAEQDGLELPNDVAMFLAESVPGNVRILEGALTRLGAQASISDSLVTVELAKSLVEQHYRSGILSKPTFSQIVGAVSRFYEVPVDEIKGVRRQAPIVHARHVAVFITREMTGDSWKHIGTLLGDRDHTSMMHGYQKINEMVRSDRALRSEVRQIMRTLQPN